jgi:N4-(beta-N-acetylglucosaminyl)-L-asparaginase
VRTGEARLMQAQLHWAVPARRLRFLVAVLVCLQLAEQATSIPHALIPAIAPCHPPWTSLHRTPGRVMERGAALSRRRMVRETRGLRLRGGGPAIAVATWDFGEIAVKEAAAHLREGWSAVDAAEAGVKAVEFDEQDQYYVGYGGLPNRDGLMEMDAAIMDGGAGLGGEPSVSRLGAVCALPCQRSAVTVARLVMDRSPHNVLVGEGALAFALSQGLKCEESLSPEARRQYEEWKQQQTKQRRKFEEWKEEQEGTSAREGASSEQERGQDTHDTVGLLCLDQNGRISAATSTSGWPYKHAGRVGDSPLVGSGLFADSKVGAAVATGDGEDIMRSCLSFLVVERMRLGDSAQRACELAIARLRSSCTRTWGSEKFHKELTVGVVALSVTGDIGVSSTLGPHNPHRGKETFPCAVWRQGVEAEGVIARIFGAENTSSMEELAAESQSPQALAGNDSKLVAMIGKMKELQAEITHLEDRLEEEIAKKESLVTAIDDTGQRFERLNFKYRSRSRQVDELKHLLQSCMEGKETTEQHNVADPSVRRCLNTQTLSPQSAGWWSRVKKALPQALLSTIVLCLQANVWWLLAAMPSGQSPACPVSSSETWNVF